MQITWMGRYREIVEALVQHGNYCIRLANYKMNIGESILLTAQEWQVLEYIVEHEEDDHNMARLSERLVIPQSSFSKMSNKLVKYGLVEKYQIVGNRKSIILKASSAGKAFYTQVSERIRKTVFEDFFNELGGFSDEQLAQFVKAISALDTKMPGNEEKQQLIKIE